MLDWLEQDVNHLRGRLQRDVAVHVPSARLCRWESARILVAPLRVDADGFQLSEHTAPLARTYVYGSAEVVGLRASGHFAAPTDCQIRQQPTSGCRTSAAV